jgi:HEAT repeat protein
MLESKDAKATIKLLIGDLSSKDGLVRMKARWQLVTYRAQSANPLIKALSNKNDWVRWEAAKALSQIGNPASIRALLKALEDNMFDVRWLAAEGLIRTGRRAVVPLLETLVRHSDSQRLREGALHILHDINKGKLSEVLRPVIAGLEGPEPSLSTPFAAKIALNTIMKKA